MSAAKGGGGQKHVTISFDDQNRIRLLDAEQFKATEQLADECTNFTDKIDSFTKTVAGLVEILTIQSQKIEKAKLIAIGERNRIESEADARKRKQNELQHLLTQKQLQLQRATEQYESLLKIEAEQKQQIEKFTKS